ncbi:glycosyltransferase family 4 protein [Dechloromonas sp. XY25]|uniref:Glycosyltransferase family 4 protein n=1 Tax=Dechloromonas hankyongensis TaxID=2908002 RepID=A0ABS9K6J0_9RHOO|nr:glycosyltransferase family 4 protein [Dechloromonas hankyongensis]MCG2578740.1 glycosyltransferase family 4 protein [Dechloromonas hankyongensis]
MLRNKLRILTWHVHGNYLYYLSHVPHTFYVLTDAARSPGYAGRAGVLPWGDNVVEVSLAEARSTAFDCVLYQSRRGYEQDRLQLLSEAQRSLPRIYLEHDPPRDNPTDTRHPVNDPNTLLVHVTHFNQLMWDSGQTPARVVEHGVVLPDGVRYNGRLARGIAVVNHLGPRGRRVGADIFAAARDQVRLDLVGMESERSGGLGEVPNDELPAFMAHYRFYFHPTRWTSLGLAAIEAMMIGLPVVGLATTELVTVIKNGQSGFVDTDPQRLIEPMRHLLEHPEEAAAMGREARKEALHRFNIDRFVADWLSVFRDVTG